MNPPPTVESVAEALWEAVTGIDRLMAEYGPAMSMPALLAILSADCSERRANETHDICGAHFPQLPGIFLKP